MKKLISLLTIIPLLGIAQDYEIANWYNFKKGTVCLTFDDGNPDHPNNVIPALNSKRLVGTFFINKMGNYSWAVNAISNGHEVSNHTLGHLHLPTLDTNLLKSEITDFQQVLATVLGTQINTLAYPYGEGGEIDSSFFYIQDTIAKTHIGARAVTQPINDTAYFYDFAQTDRAYYQVNTIHMSNNMIGYDSTFQKVMTYGGLMTYMFHNVGTAGGFDNIGLPEFDMFLDTLKGHESNIWIATFEQAIKYHREKKGALLTTKSAPFAIGNTWSLTLTDALTDSIYNHELSIKLAIPSPITGVLAAYQNSIAIPFQIINDSIVFNALPDGGDILFDVVNCVQPSDSIVVIGSTTFCTPDSVIIEAHYNSNYNYAWFKNGLSFGTDTNKIAVMESGEFYSIVSLSGCPNYSIKTTVTITGVCGVPEADFTTSTLKEFLNKEITFTSTSTNLYGGETFYWDFGVGASLSPGLYGAGPIKVSYSTSGLKSVSLTATGSVGPGIMTKTDYIEVAAMGVCDIYREDFNDEFDWNYVGCYCDYSAAIVNDAFRITTSDTIADQWFWVGWWFNDSISDTTQLAPLDFSDPLHFPVLKIRAKASDTCRLAFSLADTAGNSTAGITINQTAYIDVTTEYQNFEVDFSTLFYYEWSSPVTNLDSTQIAYLKMSINGGYKGFSFTNSFGQFVNKQFDGHVDVDWISIGEKCEMDSLIANIVLPDTVCINQTFNVWNHSIPGLIGAQFKWTFDAASTVSDTLTDDELPMPLSYTSAGTKTVTIEVTTSTGKIVTVSEKIHVRDCTVSVNELANQLTTSFVNPISSFISGKVDSNKEQEGSVILTDMSGKIIFRQNVHFNAGSNDLYYGNLDLSNGIYFLTIYTPTNKQQVKLVCTGK
ncbi:MAG: peptidoglycan/xylan/chitin deacetylase (PgdA/CDA1 family)/PKD repeat protein [Saprospiraceae bacterium]|jgi:peptidoglycan/xylan/chitin deacetylase (PgdA/CDA1 family)/PKD repeat protein